jgi:hypothetical protein
MRTVCAAAQASLLKSIQQSVATKQQSAVEVTQAYLQQLKSVEGQVQSFLTVNEEHALAQVGFAGIHSSGCADCQCWEVACATTPQQQKQLHSAQQLVHAQTSCSNKFAHVEVWCANMHGHTTSVHGCS